MGDPEVETVAGRVRGLRTAGGLVFRGLPFAAAGRFEPPGSVRPWAGVRDARQSAPVPAQRVPVFPGVPLESASEDCLYLNVWTPAAGGARRPVMVWLYGGGFETGSPSAPHTDGARLAARGDVVIVAPGYRLGALGYLYLGDSLADSVADYLGDSLGGRVANLGLLDQVAALDWVRDNISAFGGDPDNVTVFGESAGAFSIGALLALPRAAGRFHRAILMSGSTARVFPAATARRMAGDLLAALDTDPAGLLDVPVDAVLDAQAGVTDTDIGARNAPGGRSWGLVLDGTVLAEHPQDAVERGAVPDIPILVGHTSDEVQMFRMTAPGFAPPDTAALLAELTRMLGDPDLARNLHDRYAQDDPDPAAVRARFLTDWIYRIPAIRLAESWPGPAWMYQFGWRAPGHPWGAHHSLDTPFVFGMVDLPTFTAKYGTDGASRERARLMSGTMSDAWLSFARSGDPGWPGYTPDRRTTMWLDVDAHPVDDPGGELRTAWNGIIRR
jgi:para-nitrobenzyl esterase